MKKTKRVFMRFITIALLAAGLLTQPACKKSDGTANASLIGVYSGGNTCGSTPYIIDIIAGVNGSQIQFAMTNFGYIYANVSGNTFTVPSQPIDYGAASSTITGNGSVSNGTLTFEYTISGVPCTFTGSK